MKLNRFEVVTGRYIEEIPGQSRIGYGQKKAGIKVQLFLFMITIMVKFMNHFKNRKMCYMELLFI